MKKVQIALCALLVFALTIGFTTQVFATDISTTAPTSNNDLKEIISENFGHMLDSVLNRAEFYGVSAENFDDFVIMDPVSFNTLDEDEEIDDSEAVLHFPIADETGEICLIYDVIITDHGYSATIGSDFAPLLNSIYQDNATSVALIQDEYSFYAISDSSGYLQQGGNVVNMNKADFEKLSARGVELTSITLSSLTANNEFTSIGETSLAMCVGTRAEINSSAVTGTKSLTNYPIVDQVIDGKQYGLCWAATVASIVRFEKPTLYGSLTAKDVADYMEIGYDEGGTNAESKEALEHYLGSPYAPTLKSDVLTQAQIKTAIDNIDPAYMQCRRPNGFLRYKYHAVAMIGYDFTSNYTRIEIMDPAYACYKYCTMDSNDNWTFAFGAYTYTWIKTIRLLYST